jgi:hypothetical protein
VGTRHQRGGRVRQPDAAAAPLEQLLAGLELQLGELLRDRRRRDVQRLGGGDDRAMGGNGVQRAQAIKIRQANDSKLNHQELFTSAKSSRDRS